MKSRLLLAAMITILAVPAHGANLQKELKERWLGAWVIIGVESYSDCQGMFTNNRINQNLVKSSGRHGFQAGELAKVHKIDLKRSRLDLLLMLEEPLLMPYQEGPFTLYREVECKVEFEVELPREAVKSKDVDSIEERLSMVLERYPDRESATRSETWNGREIEPYPDDYDRTLAELAIWRAEQTNAGVQAQLDRAYEEVYRLVDRLDSDPPYLAGFSKGVEEARSYGFYDCSHLLAFDLDSLRPGTHGHHSPPESDEARTERGGRDGRLLIYGLELIRRLPDCFVPVPEMPPEYLDE